jgi:hypothetical protein
MRRNDCLAAVTRELELAGVHYTVRRGGKHLRVAVAGQPDIIVALSPSDWRAPKRARAFVQRRLREHRR